LRHYAGSGYFSANIIGAMRFTLNDIELNLTAGSILQHGVSTSIRAKTLLVLKYLITHRDKIVTKQELLTTIWHDIVVQEQVLVQSIKEIRKLLGSEVIKTYPRQGYQWTAELAAVEPSNKSSNKSRLSYVVLACFLLFIVVGYLIFNSTKTSETSPQINLFNVAFLPVENDMPDDIHDWVPLEGMSFLSRRLQQYSGLSVTKDQALINAFKHAENDQQQVIDSPLEKQQQIANLKAQLGLDLLVHTRLLGYPQDFQLQYSFYLKHNVERGVLFADSVEHSFEQLIDLISKRYGENTRSNNSEHSAFKRDFSNEAFARGIELYLKREYKNAMPFFSSALQVNPDLLAARRYLAASSVNNGELQAGIKLMLSNIEQAQANNNRREAIRSYLMIGVLLINWPLADVNLKENLTRAEKYIETAKALAEQADDALFTAYSYEELGKIKRLQGEYRQAINLLSKALSSHKKVLGNYSQTNTLIELSRVSAEQKNYVKAQLYLQQAQLIANKNGVATNKVWIFLALADIAQLQGLVELTNQNTQQAMNIAKTAKNPLLINRVNAWLNDHEYYEIN